MSPLAIDHNSPEGIDARTEALRDEARALRASGDAVGETAAWEELLALDDCDEAHARLADLLPGLGRDAEVVGHLHALARGDPQSVRTWVEQRSQDLMSRLTAKDFPGTKYHSVPAFYGRAASKLVDIRNDRLFVRLAEEARKGGRTLLYLDRLFTLYQAVVNAVSRVPPGGTARMLEVGVYKGGGSFFMASVAQALLGNRFELIGVDTFRGHAFEDIPTGAEGAHLPLMFGETGYADVAAYLAPFPTVRVIEARIQDAWNELQGMRFDLIHLDVDIYEPTAFTLDKSREALASRGAILVDDYGFVTCPGVRKAVDDYVAKRPRRFAKFELLTGQCLLLS